MIDFSRLSPWRAPGHGERQVMDALNARGEATFAEIQSAIPHAPLAMALRRMSFGPTTSSGAYLQVTKDSLIYAPDVTASVSLPGLIEANRELIQLKLKR